MAINFPDNPTPNDTFTDGGRTWIWDGTTWKIYSSTASGIGLNQLSVTNASVGTSALSYNNTTGVFTYTPPDLSGYLTQQYTLPTASTTVLGGVKVDGSTITINGSGVISGASTYNDGDVDARLNTATASSGKILSWTGTDYAWISESVPTSISVTDETVDTESFPLFTTTATGNLAPKTSTNFKFNTQTGQIEAGSYKKTGGTASEFLKADGSIDSTTYLTNTSSGSGASAVVPVGGIIMWSGDIASIPSGWALCNGANGTPDLRDKFVVGATSDSSGTSYPGLQPGASGGEAEVTLTEAQLPSHTHTWDRQDSSTNAGYRPWPANNNDVVKTTTETGATGGDQPHNNLPPYLTLAFIMRTS